MEIRYEYYINQKLINFIIIKLIKIMYGKLDHIFTK